MKSTTFTSGPFEHKQAGLRMIEIKNRSGEWEITFERWNEQGFTIHTYTDVTATQCARIALAFRDRLNLPCFYDGLDDKISLALTFVFLPKE